jgi:hypothetical protein
MAGQEHVVKLTANVPPWPLVFELASTLPKGSWVLVGGLMVHIHALRAGVVAMRPTSDVDLLLDIATTSVGEIGRAIIGRGFATVEPSRGSPVHRFTRGEDVVDVMVARDVRVPTRWMRRPILRAPGTAQALLRRDTYTIEDGERSAELQVPDPLGAIIAKAAAYAVDSRNPQRHLEDLAVLGAATGTPRTLDLDTLTPTDRRHLNRVIPFLLDPRNSSWATLDPYDREIGQRIWGRIAAGMER